MICKGFICPICGNPLIEKDNALHCIKNHSFDISKEGYTYLLPIQKKHSNAPGDTKEMVNSRAKFLESGFYDIFSDTLAEICLETAKAQKKTLHILDMGCGEGYYNRAIAKRLTEAGVKYELIGFDISKTAVRRAAKLAPENCFYTVASCFTAPVKSTWADLVINVFAPLAQKEVLRTLRKGGKFIYAVPGAEHLFGLKQILYENPYKNPVQDTEYEGLEFEEVIERSRDIHIEDENIYNLFCMTPYYWKTPKDGSEKLQTCKALNTHIEFRFLKYIKK